MANPVTLRAFIELDVLKSQNAITTSTIGEMSQLSFTYSKNLIEIAQSAYPGETLYSFSCLDNVSNLEIAVPSNIATLALSVINIIVKYSQNNTAPFVGLNFINTVIANSNNAIGNVTIGMFTTLAPIMTLPDWISFIDVIDGSTIKIWLADNSFQSEYDLSSIIIIPPIPVLDTFFQPTSILNTALSAVTTVDTINNIQTAKTIYPETALVSMNIDYIMSNNTVIPTTWTAIINGQSNSSLDIIKTAMQNFIAANTSQPLASWQVIFPSIYNKTEFIIVPRWDIYAIPTATTITGLYQSMTNGNDDIKVATDNIPFYNSAIIPTNLIITPHYYKYIMLLIVNGPNNVPTAADIRQLYPDYIPQSSISLDYNRMTQATQQWSSTIESMLMVAETMTGTSVLPVGMGRVTRSGKLYLQLTMNNIDYLMLPKVAFIF